MKLYTLYVQKKYVKDIIGARGDLNSYVLYAFTSEKELMDGFREFRNPKIFKLKVSKHVSKEEYNQFQNKNSINELQSYSLLGRNPEDPHKTINIPVVMTLQEKMNVDTFIESDPINEFTTVNPLLFGLDTIRALNTLGYLYRYKYASSTPTGYTSYWDYVSEQLETFDNDIGIDDLTDSEYDEFQIFIDLMESTF